MSIELEEFKVCSHCKIPRVRTEYSKKSDAFDGLQSWCKVCMKNRSERRPKKKLKQLKENIYYKPVNNNKLDLLIRSVLIYHKVYKNIPR
jgi:hypothetical protein